MKLEQIPYLPLVNHGSALREAALKVLNHAQVNQLYSRDYALWLKAFFADQSARVASDNGHPADGTFFGLGTPDIRQQCYQCLSDVRLRRGDIPKSAQLKDFFDTCSTLADGLANYITFTPQGTIQIAPSNQNSVIYAKAATGFDSSVRNITIGVQPVATPLAVNRKALPAAVTTALANRVLTLTCGNTPEAVHPIAINGLYSSGSPAVLDLNVEVVFKNPVTASVPALTVGTNYTVPANFIDVFGAGTIRKFVVVPAQYASILTYNAQTNQLVPVGAGSAYVFGVVEYTAVPGLLFADRSSVTVSSAAGQNQQP